MSQKKVDAYKDYKKNKDKILKKEKRMARFEIGAFAIVCAAFLAWVGFSVYQKATVKAPEAETEAVAATEINMTDYIEYMSELPYGY
ncbi:MAG: hypothetical protein J6D46_09220 [Lachnospiraceae bacterium]|nr:hypothetical protein [Lachnospiraceae bacterium]